MAQCEACKAKPDRTNGIVVREPRDTYGPHCNECWSLWLNDETVLASREADVAALKEMGYADMEIADILGIERSTVTTIMSRVRAKGERAERTVTELRNIMNPGAKSTEDT
jgi:DNA-binding CsgD family transcriptional regulator